MFFKQLKNACASRGTTPSSVIRELGMTRGSLTNWKKGVFPSSEVIIKLSNKLNVSTDYLLLGRNSPILTSVESEIFEMYRSLQPFEQGRFYGQLKERCRALFAAESGADGARSVAPPGERKNAGEDD